MIEIDRDGLGPNDRATPVDNAHPILEERVGGEGSIPATSSRRGLECSSAELAAFIGEEKLPAAFSRTISQIYKPLARSVIKRLHELGRPCLVGISGPQGAGKSTAAAIVRRLLQAEGLRAASLSIDDIYLTRAERKVLAETIHPLLITRGPPGTHDLNLGETVLQCLLNGGDIALPLFDKALDDRCPESRWDRFKGPADVVLFEGWCVGAAPQHDSALLDPVNDLEREQDSAGIWRTFVNDALLNYQPLFSQIDFLILLQPTSFEHVTRWRREQEAKLRARTSPDRDPLRIMTDAEVNEFVQYFERLTRKMICEMPRRADAVVKLGPDRQLCSLMLRQTGAAFSTSGKRT